MNQLLSGWMRARVLFVLLMVVLGAGCTGGSGGNDNSDSNGNANSNSNENDNSNVNSNDNGVSVEVPALLGLDTAKALTLPLEVQVAFNDDTIFFRLQFEGDRGDRHDYQHFTNGQWQTEGGHRRDGQSTIDDDPVRGRTNVTSTIYESRATFMINDPNGPNAVPRFAEQGCMLTCHDNSRTMPTWTEESGDVRKYLNDDNAGILDLWHWRIARANPIGYSDDQYVSTIPEGGLVGSRNNDAGTHPPRTNDLDESGNPLFVFDPATTAGAYAFSFDELYSTDLYYATDPNATNLGPLAPNPTILAYADAIALGYVPQEGDAVPGRILQQPTDSAADITSRESEFIPSAGDPNLGTWIANLQRKLDTGHSSDDVALAEGGVYDIAFAVHIGKVTVRDHYVSFSYTLSLDGGPADIVATRIGGSGASTLPNWENTGEFPTTRLNLFLPGISSWEYLIGENADLTYVDPNTGLAVTQTHGGATFITQMGLGCRDCHTVTSAETFAPPNAGGFNAGPMETLAGLRGGILHPTPIPTGAGE